MTDKAVELSITIKVNREVVNYQREIKIEELETGVSQTVQEIGNKVLVAGLKGLDDEIRKEVPAGWRNVRIKTKGKNMSQTTEYFEEEIKKLVELRALESGEWLLADLLLAIYKQLEHTNTMLFSIEREVSGIKLG